MSDDAYLDAYLGVVERVSEMATRADSGRLDDVVPSCPAWSAFQVVSHLAGLAEDWVTGNLAGYGSDEWAQAQADRFADRPLDDLLEAWRAAADRFGQLGPSPLGATPARWAFGDAVTHEADLRPVLAPGTRVPAEAVALALQGAIGRWRVELANAAAPPLDVVATDLRSWPVGDSEARATQPAATVTTTSYDVFRALFGRRSRSQMEAWDWTCDPAPWLDVGLPYPFSPADTHLDD